MYLCFVWNDRSRFGSNRQFWRELSWRIFHVLSHFHVSRWDVMLCNSFNFVSSQNNFFSTCSALIQKVLEQSSYYIWPNIRSIFNFSVTLLEYKLPGQNMLWETPFSTATFFLPSAVQLCVPNTQTGCQLCLHNSKWVLYCPNFCHGQFLNLVASKDLTADILREVRYADSP